MFYSKAYKIWYISTFQLLSGSECDLNEIEIEKKIILSGEKQNQ